jgi:hypothetical protein
MNVRGQRSEVIVFSHPRRLTEAPEHQFFWLLTSDL